MPRKSRKVIEHSKKSRATYARRQQNQAAVVAATQIKTETGSPGQEIAYETALDYYVTRETEKRLVAGPSVEPKYLDSLKGDLQDEYSMLSCRERGRIENLLALTNPAFIQAVAYDDELRRTGLSVSGPNGRTVGGRRRLPDSDSDPTSDSDTGSIQSKEL